MSTKERYGTAVWLALVELFMEPTTSDEAWITVGEVARRAGCSNPTAKKYLDELRDKGNAKRIMVGATLVAYRPEWVIHA